MSKLAFDFLTTNIDKVSRKWYKYVVEEMTNMVVEEINLLKKQLESQIIKEDSYDLIYETSVKIDKLLIDYYNQLGSIKKDLNY